MLIHIQPENILMDEMGRTKISDLGLACYVGPDGVSGACGTRGYWAPDMIRRDKDGRRKRYTWTADYFSLGVLVYEFLTGKTTFSPHMVLKAVTRQEQAAADLMAEIVDEFTPGHHTAPHNNIPAKPPVGDVGHAHAEPLPSPTVHRHTLTGLVASALSGKGLHITTIANKNRNASFTTNATAAGGGEHEVTDQQGTTATKKLGKEERARLTDLATLEYEPDYTHDTLDAISIDLIKRLLKKHSSERLGSDGGIEEIMAHPFFKGVDFQTLDYGMSCV